MAVAFAADAQAQWGASSLHIHIDRMDSMVDPDSRLLAALQADLPYPWLPPERLREQVRAVARQFPAQAGLEDFGSPVTLPDPSAPLTECAR